MFDHVYILRIKSPLFTAQIRSPKSCRVKSLLILTLKALIAIVNDKFRKSQNVKVKQINIELNLKFIYEYIQLVLCVNCTNVCRIQIAIVILVDASLLCLYKVTHYGKVNVALISVLCIQCCQKNVCSSYNVRSALLILSGPLFSYCQVRSSHIVRSALLILLGTCELT